MSSLLGEAIVDAKALRESALKNAESTIIEKYSDEVKKTLEQLLEQEDELGDLGLNLDADPAADAPPTLVPRRCRSTDGRLPKTQPRRRRQTPGCCWRAPRAAAASRPRPLPSPTP